MTKQDKAVIESNYYEELYQVEEGLEWIKSTGMAGKLSAEDRDKAKSICKRGMKLIENRPDWIPVPDLINEIAYGKIGQWLRQWQP